MNNQREIYEALLAGEILIHDRFKAYMKNDVVFDELDCIANYSFYTPEKWEIYSPPKWYENIPEGGVLCWVRNFDDQEWSRYPYLIIAYQKGTHPFYSPEPWKQAKPLTKQEIQVFMTNAPDDV